MRSRRSIKDPRVITALFLASLLVVVAPLATAHPHDPHDPPQPYQVSHEGRGIIGCSVAYRPIHTSDFCAGRDENVKNEFEFSLDPGLTSMVFHLKSDPSQMTGDTAELSVTFLSPPGAFGAIQGAPPFLVTFDVDENDTWSGWEDPPPLKFELRANPDATTPQFAFQQPIRWCITTFYNGAEVPEDHHPCPDE